MLKAFRKRLENSETLAAFLAGLAARYLGVCERTTKWTIIGRDDLVAATQDGPVLVVMWHERSIMGALHWPAGAGPLSSLYANSPIGRVSGALQRRMGLLPMQMSDRTSNVAASRAVLKRAREGVSIALTGDGPLGPAMALKDAPLEWARVTGMPVFAYAFSTRRFRTLDTWDRMMVPRPFGQGAKVYRRFEAGIPRKMDDADREALRSRFADFLTETMAEADGLARG
ncbi:lysophospholipid acyltransferase family protein [Yoonia sp.]|uniref:lysophospholipid acyltransferase family protein n=1 Tax=Yoonia sp. TaxID=2212373 RepID=UPI002FDA0753